LEKRAQATNHWDAYVFQSSHEHNHSPIQHFNKLSPLEILYGKQQQNTETAFDPLQFYNSHKMLLNSMWEKKIVPRDNEEPTPSHIKKEFQTICRSQSQSIWKVIGKTE
jgi:hypothetical protein